MQAASGREQLTLVRLLSIYPASLVEAEGLELMASTGDLSFCLDQSPKPLTTGASTMAKKTGKTKSKRLSQGWRKHLRRMKQAARRATALPR
jgi:hypothetical protein